MPRTSANRTDLLTPPPASPVEAPGQPNGQPIQVPTGLPYGENQQLTQAQQAVPLGAAPIAPANPPGVNGGGDPTAALQAARQFQMPQNPPLERRTERPTEPVTAGLPGQPPGQTPPVASAAQPGMAALIGRMAQASGSAALSQLAQRAQTLGQ